MPNPYYEPKTVAPILQAGLAQQAPYVAQPKGGFTGALPALGQLADTTFQVAANRDKKQSILQAQQAYADYLAKVDNGTATPDDHKTGTIAALSLGLTPPSAGTVAPDIWNAVQTEGGFKTNAPGTKENVAAGEALARMKGTTKQSARDAALAAVADKKSAAEAAKTKVGDDKFWSQQFRVFTPTNASRGSLIGQAAYGNARADRALKVLERGGGKITPQDLNKVIVDLAGIMQGGSPHADAIASQGYNTLAEQWANLKTRINGTPNAANIPEIVNELKNTVRDIKDVDSKIIQDNLDTFEATNSGYIERNPDKWSKIKSSVMRGTVSSSDSAAPAGAPAGAPATTAADYVKGLNLGATK